MKFFNNYLHNCEETSLNIVKSGEISLSFSTRLKMKVHLVFCKCCRNFSKQTKIIDKALQFHFHSEPDPMDEYFKASPDFKNRIKENLKRL